MYNGDSDYLHEVQTEGLPNIEGNLYAMATDVSNSSNGCFTMQLVRDARDEGGSGNFKYYNIQLKASTSNPIYGSSEHVTALNSAIQIWRRIS